MKSSMRCELCSPVNPFSDETQRLGEFAVGGIVNYYFFWGPVHIYQEILLSYSTVQLNTCSVPFFSASNVGKGKYHMQCLHSSMSCPASLILNFI